MTDVLPVLVIVPQQFTNLDKIGMLLMTTETAFQVNKWDMKIEPTFRTIDKADGAVYDAQFRIRTNLLRNDDLEAMARLALNSAKRKSYVIMVCSDIIEADSMITNDIRTTGTNAESITGHAVSCMKLIAPKSTVGDGDGRTWAHEIGHGLGLGHVNDNDSNFMSPSRHGANGQITGFDIQPGQIELMQFYCQKLVSTGF